jgi:hypothetical protein
MSRETRLRLLVDALGLTVILLTLADLFRPSLLLLPTITAGGDTRCCSTTSPSPSSSSPD